MKKEISEGREKGIEKKKPYVEPELIKHEEKLDEVTHFPGGSAGVV